MAGIRTRGDGLGGDIPIAALRTLLSPALGHREQRGVQDITGMLGTLGPNCPIDLGLDAASSVRGLQKVIELSAHGRWRPTRQQCAGRGEPACRHKAIRKPVCRIPKVPIAFHDDTRGDTARGPKQISNQIFFPWKPVA